MVNNDRAIWLEILMKIADPVIQALEEEQLKEKMPVEQGNQEKQGNFSYLEAFARLANGMATWLEGVCNLQLIPFRQTI
ncbi:DUF2264 domain-containing protein [Gracilibacillus sp. YIM 98692]|uniref:DUF2264 domain-containing protein n=1 Tax=Gracilibacillus sp. YIM 98692 TaxID=2663532 RepID=UPI0013D334E4|nr:DUF2264 domain-containing protein [Gracilibacillus sp. YIM 98692]